MDLTNEYIQSENWTPDLFDQLRHIRETDPVFWSEKDRCWIITRFEDVCTVSKNQEVFTSAEGVRPNNPARLGLIDEGEPRHGKLRKLINKGFTPRMVNKLEVVFRDIAREAIDAVASKGECDFVEDIAVPLPLILIAEMIGIRKEDRKDFHRWSDAMIAGDGNTDKPEIMARAAAAFMEYSSYVGEIIADRRKEPKDDLTSILVTADEEGILGRFDRTEYASGIETPEQLERANSELIMLMVILLVAGNETTRNGISGGMQLLIENPEARQRLIDDPSLIPQAVEEMVRLTSPVRSFSRTVTRDTELRGKRLKKGDIVLMVYPMANTDPREFENPDVFDIDRHPHHVAFGIGSHFCLGANLARMEMRVAFEELLRRLPDMEYSDGGPRFVPSGLVRTCAEMKVKFTPEA